MNIFVIATQTIYMTTQAKNPAQSKPKSTSNQNNAVQKKTTQVKQATASMPKSQNASVRIQAKQPIAKPAAAIQEPETKLQQEKALKSTTPKKEKKLEKHKLKQEKRKKKRQGFAMSKLMQKRISIINDDLSQTMEDCVVRFKKMKNGD